MRDQIKTLVAITTTSLCLIGAGTAFAQQAETPETEVETIQSEETVAAPMTDEAVKIEIRSEKTMDAEAIELTDDTATTDAVEEIEPAANAAETDVEPEAETEAEETMELVDQPELP